MPECECEWLRDLCSQKLLANKFDVTKMYLEILSALLVEIQWNTNYPKVILSLHTTILVMNECSAKALL